VTADAVRFSIERALSPKLGSDILGMRFLDDVVGPAEFSVGAAKHVSGIRVSGDTVSITLTKPSRTFLHGLPFRSSASSPRRRPSSRPACRTTPRRAPAPIT
jgi:ABC-type transport system substrate-binding protein